MGRVANHATWSYDSHRNATPVAHSRRDGGTHKETDYSVATLQFTLTVVDLSVRTPFCYGCCWSAVSPTGKRSLAPSLQRQRRLLWQQSRLPLLFFCRRYNRLTRRRDGCRPRDPCCARCSSIPTCCFISTTNSYQLTTFKCCCTRI